jgi:hypothetical protein
MRIEVNRGALEILIANRIWNSNDPGELIDYVASGLRLPIQNVSYDPVEQSYWVIVPDASLTDYFTEEEIEVYGLKNIEG